MTLMEIKERTLLREKIYEMIKEAIITGELSPGKRLVETKLVEDIGISRTPIREALRKLESEGYVTPIKQGGVKVSEITEDDIHEWYEIKKVLDNLAIIKAIDYITQKQIEDLDNYIEKSKELLEEEDFDKEEMVKLHAAFHQKIFEASNNKLIKMIMEDYQHYNLRLRNYMSDLFDWNEKMIEQHEKILEAIKEKNKEKAKKLINDHSLTGKEDFIKRIKNSKKNAK